MTKILLVEDNEMNRDMLSRRLERRGYEVVIAVDGQQGVDLAQSTHPDLILMDMSLPVIDGWEATRQLKAKDGVQEHSHHRPHRARDVRRPREGAGGGLRRLRHQADRAAAPPGQDRGAAGGPGQAVGMTTAAGGPPDRARDALLAHLRHELRTPVNAILGYSEMLLEDETPGRARPDLQKIQTAGRTLLALINEILDPARLGAAASAGDLEVAGARIRQDLRTPVNAILGHTQMLIDGAEASGHARQPGRRQAHPRRGPEAARRHRRHRAALQRGGRRRRPGRSATSASPP